MNIDNFKNTWQEQANTIDSAVKINKGELSKIKMTEHQQKFQRLKLMRVCECLAFIIIILLLLYYIVNNLQLTAPTISAGILAVFSVIGVVGSFGQIVLIHQLDYSEPVNTLQKSIFKIAAHKLNFTKLIFLSAPFYLSYPILGFDILWGIDFYQLLNNNIITVYLVVSALFLSFVVFMAVKLNYKNISTPWVKKVIEALVGKELVEMSGVVNNLER